MLIAMIKGKPTINLGCFVLCLMKIIVIYIGKAPSINAKSIKVRSLILFPLCLDDILSNTVKEILMMLIIIK